MLPRALYRYGRRVRTNEKIKTKRNPKDPSTASEASREEPLLSCAVLNGVVELEGVVNI